jgi:hypothetical protein
MKNAFFRFAASIRSIKPAARDPDRLIDTLCRCHVRRGARICWNQQNRKAQDPGRLIANT